MPSFERAGVSLYYEEYGNGHPMLLFAPGGMRSSIEFWHRSPFDPTVELAGDFRVIAMDQRNAGRSRGPINAADGWHTYTSDHLALLDHLGIQRSHIMGGCIGGSYCFNMIKTAAERISAAVIQNPIGLKDNRDAFREMFDGWAKELKSQRPELDENAFRSFRENMYGGDFVFTVTRDFVSKCSTPMILLNGSDMYHPAEISAELAWLNPRIEVIPEWKTPEAAKEAVRQIRTFLKRYSS
ncbi:MAG TPA: alpha/beta hydrolase [Candidatus Binataceae bacterium]|nr:alpha/beta hydrolase [Candidatus Binataceae bacterium]